MIFEAVFTDTTNEGFGVTRDGEGKTVFVSGALTGERATVKIIKELKSYSIGRIEALSEPSPHRAAPDCETYKRCGGCVFRHTSYENELSIKRSFIENALQKAGVTAPPLSTPLHGDPNGYRNKLLLPVSRDENGLYCGFYAGRSHNVIKCAACRLHTDDFAQISAWLLALLQNVSAYDEKSGTGT